MEEFLDQLHEKAQTLFATLAPVVFILMVVSLWSNVANGNRSATMYLRPIIHLIVVAMLLSQFANWLGAGVRIVGSLVVDELQASPHEMAKKFMAMSASASDEADGGFWHMIFNLSAEEFFKLLSRVCCGSYSSSPRWWCSSRGLWIGFRRGKEIVGRLRQGRSGQ